MVSFSHRNFHGFSTPVVNVKITNSGDFDQFLAKKWMFASKPML
jgi:hypothetical protein